MASGGKSASLITGAIGCPPLAAVRRHRRLSRQPRILRRKVGCRTGMNNWRQIAFSEIASVTKSLSEHFPKELVRIIMGY
jgi:hypothetical protein